MPTAADEDADAARGPGDGPRRDTRAARWRRAARRAVPALLAVAVVAGLAALFAGRLAPGPTGPAIVVPADWQTYRDPLGLFSIRVPAEWKIERSENSGSFGDRTGSYSYTGEDLWLGVPPRGADGFGVFINVVPLTTDFARQSTCRGAWPRDNTALGGVPAYHDPGSTWLIETRDAHYQVNAHYPGGPESPHTSPDMQTTPPTPTPVPPAQLAIARRTMEAVLASFSLAYPAPLTCPAP